MHRSSRLLRLLLSILPILFVAPSYGDGLNMIFTVRGNKLKTLKHQADLSFARNDGFYSVPQDTSYSSNIDKMDLFSWPQLWNTRNAVKQINHESVGIRLENWLRLIQYKFTSPHQRLVRFDFVVIQEDVKLLKTGSSEEIPGGITNSLILILEEVLDDGWNQEITRFDLSDYLNQPQIALEAIFDKRLAEIVQLLERRKKLIESQVALHAEEGRNSDALSALNEQLGKLDIRY